MTRANADGQYPVYVIVKNQAGRFFVNTGIVTCGRLEGRTFCRSDKMWRQKTTILGGYLASVGRVCLEQSLHDADNKTLKAAIQREVFGIVPQKKTEYLHDIIRQFAETKRMSTAVLYGITERKVAAFDPKATLESVDASWLERYRKHCIDSGMRINGAGKELRNIRAVFNWARRQGKTSNYPFLDYSIVEEETQPNSLTTDELCRLRDYPCEPWQEKYRDFFMLSFYLAGMNPVDLLTCRSDAVNSGHLTFVRKKTDKQGQHKVRSVVLPVVDEAAAILSRYRSKEGWLLSFMDGRKDYRSFLKKADKALKKIGGTEIVPDKLGKMRKVKYHPILPDVTMYSARYSFGSIAANELDISERTIGMCLGHAWSKQVTSRYISHDQRKVDDAVRKVVAFVAQHNTEP